MEKIYDIIIWGASGFTGRLAVDYIYKNQNNSNLTWAVAGRNESKIKEIIDGKNIPIHDTICHEIHTLQFFSYKNFLNRIYNG